MFKGVELAWIGSYTKISTHAVLSNNLCHGICHKLKAMVMVPTLSWDTGTLKLIDEYKHMWHGLPL